MDVKDLRRKLKLNREGMARLLRIEGDRAAGSIARWETEGIDKMKGPTLLLLEILDERPSLANKYGLRELQRSHPFQEGPGRLWPKSDKRSSARA